MGKERRGGEGGGKERRGGKRPFLVYLQKLNLA